MKRWLIALLLLELLAYFGLSACTCNLTINVSAPGLQVPADQPNPDNTPKSM